MSRSQFFTYFLLGSLLTACGRADRIVTHIIKDNDLRHNCAFELNGHGYNLCPLAEERVVVEGSGVAKSYDEDKGEGSSSEGRFYEVTLGGLDAYSFSTRVTSGLEVGALMSLWLVEVPTPFNIFQGSGCGEDTWVCMLGESAFRAGKFPAILGGAITYRCVEMWRTRTDGTLSPAT